MGEMLLGTSISARGGVLTGLILGLLQAFAHSQGRRRRGFRAAEPGCGHYPAALFLFYCQRHESDSTQRASIVRREHAEGADNKIGTEQRDDGRIPARRP